MNKHLPLLLAVLVAAALAGTASAVLVSSSLERYAATLLDDRRFAAFASSQRSAPTSLEESLKSIQETVRNTQVFFVQAGEVKNTPVWGSEYVQGEGVIMSADGWILTTRRQLEAFAEDDEYTGFAVVFQGEVFTVDKVVRDTQTDAVAVRVQNAKGWTPIALAQSDEGGVGASVFGIGTLGEIYGVSVESRGVQEGESYVVPAEEPRSMWSVSDVLSEGIPVLTNQARLFGLVIEEKYVLPAQAVRPFVRQVLRGSSVEHAALGATVVDIAIPSSESKNETSRYQDGAMIAPTTGERSGIVANGPADKAGLTDGDILLAVDDVRITSQVPLADILALYAPDQQITLQVARNGEVKEMRVTLGTWEELVY